MGRDSYYRTGKSFSYSNIRLELYNQCFIILADRMGVKEQPPAGAGPSSLYILTENNPIRKITKYIIEWPPFEYAVLLTIIANCVVLALEEHLPNGDKTILALKLVTRVRFRDVDRVSDEDLNIGILV